MDHDKERYEDYMRSRKEEEYLIDSTKEYEKAIQLLLARVDVDVNEKENGVSPKTVSDFGTLIKEYGNLKKIYNNNYQPKKYTQNKEEIKATEFKTIFKKQLEKLAENELGQKFLCQIGELLNEDHKLRIKLTNKGSSRYDASSNTITYSFLNLIAARCDDETDYFTLKPLIKECAKIAGEEVVKISDGLSPLYFSIMHELGHYRDHKNELSRKKIVEGWKKHQEKIKIRDQAEQKSQSKQATQTTGAKKRTNSLGSETQKTKWKKITSTNEVSKQEIKQNKTETIDKIPEQEFTKLQRGDIDFKLSPLGRINSVTSSGAIPDDLLEHKNIFTMDDNDVSELSLRAAMGEPLRYLYQALGTKIYEPLDTVLKKAAKFAVNKEVSKNSTHNLIKKLDVSNNLDPDVSVEYMKIRFAPHFPEAFNKFASNSDFNKARFRKEFMERLEKYGGTRNQYTFNNETTNLKKWKELIEADNNKEEPKIPARIKSKILARLIAQEATEASKKLSEFQKDEVFKKLI